MSNVGTGVQAAEGSNVLPEGLTPEMLAELKRSFRELRTFTTGGESIVCRQPKRAEWERFQMTVDADDSKQFKALEELLGLCIVFPTAARVEALWERRPAYIKKFGMGLIRWAAGDDQLEKKDL